MKLDTFVCMPDAREWEDDIVSDGSLTFSTSICQVAFYRCFMNSEFPEGDTGADDYVHCNTYASLFA